MEFHGDAFHCAEKRSQPHPATAVTFALSLLFFSTAQSIMQPWRCGLACLPWLRPWRVRENRFPFFPFYDKDLAQRTPKKKGLRHIAAARKYNREEFRLDPIFP
ncbi:hypothetical protein [Herbaspirillum sp. NPDC087042]|uniref:hypothetical protein n=1 Tax=Herbaspirillum sp. NPDC087042 TaxID=3364004 RepID=UPI00381D18DC